MPPAIGEKMSTEQQAIGLIILGFACAAVIPLFIGWLVAVPHREIQTDFDTLTERNKR